MAKRWIAAAAAVPIAGTLVIPLAVTAGVTGAVLSQPPSACAAVGAPGAPVSTVSLGASERFAAEQRSIGAAAVKVADQRHLGDRAKVIILATGFVESGVRNLPYGDRDSLGWLQQRASWGPRSERMNPAIAAGKFYDHLVRISNWQTRPVGVVAQAVQVSAFPGRYAQWQRAATQLLASVTGKTPLITTTTPAPAACGPGQTPGQPAGPMGVSFPVGGYRVVKGVRIPIPKGSAGVAINFALNQIGKPYVWAAHGPNAYDCSGLASAAWKAGGKNIYPQTEVMNRTVPHVPLSQARPGDILYHHIPEGHVQIFLGIIGGKWTVVEAANPRVGIRLDQSYWMKPETVLRP